jgi:hypothetical protein
VDIANESDEVVEVKTGWAVDDDPAAVWTSGNPWETGGVSPWYLSTRTAPGATSALSGRLYPGTLVADCFADGTALPGIVITARSQITCQGPPIDPDDPADIIRALGIAFNDRDPNAVCSLFSNDATAELVGGREPEHLEGNESLAVKLTFLDDNLWMKEIVFHDIEASDSVVSWVSEWDTFTGIHQWCNTAEVHDGKILTFYQGPCPPGA